MTEFLSILWVFEIIIFIRSGFLATGSTSSKLFKVETFLFWQKLLAIIIVAGGTLAYFESRQFNTYVLGQLVSLFLLFLFYLQPTPRTSKNILLIYLVVNLIFAIFIIF